MGDEEADEVGTGVDCDPGAMIAGAVDHEVSVAGAVAVSGRMSGDIAAAAATTGAVRARISEASWIPGVETPGSNGAEASVDAGVRSSVR